ncbi:MAG: tetratricopeptide repeat protein [Gemmatimonadota bacterium]
MTATTPTVALLLASLALAPTLSAQATRADSFTAAATIDASGKHTEARAIYSALIKSAPDAALRAAATRRLAVSYAYDGNCTKSTELEEQVLAYWASRRVAEPQNAHNQEGEIANEAARICIDNGDLDRAEKLYRRGAALGLAEPEPRTHAKALWDYRLAHALGRLAARRGNATEAKHWVTEARRLLDSDTTLAKAQEVYYPYLVGYVALYTNDLATAEANFTQTMKSLPNDPFQVVLMGMTLEKKGDTARARALFQQAYDRSTGATLPQIYSRTFTAKKLGLH